MLIGFTSSLHLLIFVFSSTTICGIISDVFPSSISSLQTVLPLWACSQCRAAHLPTQVHSGSGTRNTLPNWQHLTAWYRNPNQLQLKTYFSIFKLNLMAHIRAQLRFKLTDSINGSKLCWRPAMKFCREKKKKDIYEQIQENDTKNKYINKMMALRRLPSSPKTNEICGNCCT